MLSVGDPPVRVMTVSELPAEMASGEWFGRCRPVKQFIMDWNDSPDARHLLLDAEPVGEHPFDLAVIAVSVAGLCERDGVPEPGWVDQHRWDGTPHLLIGWEVNCPWSREVAANAPAVCGRFNVYFGEDWLEASIANKFARHIAAAGDNSALLAEMDAKWARVSALNWKRLAVGLPLVGTAALDVAGGRWGRGAGGG